MALFERENKDGGELIGLNSAVYRLPRYFEDKCEPPQFYSPSRLIAKRRTVPSGTVFDR